MSLINPVLTKHPRGLYILLFAELWERYAFYTIQTLLILFLVENFNFTDSKAYALYGGFSSLIFLTPLIGGYLADNFLGARMAIYIGSLFYIVGFFSIAIFGYDIFYMTLACLIIGNGFFKSNISSLLGALYQENDIRRDSAYTIFYLGINIGALMASILSSYIATRYGWYMAFGVAGCGMLVGFLTCLATFKQLGEHGLLTQSGLMPQKIIGLSAKHGIILAAIVSMFLLTKLLQLPTLLQYLYFIFSIAAFLFLITLAFRYVGVERNKIFAILLYSALSILFWVLYSQIFSLMTLFTQRCVTRELFGWTIPSTMFTGLNPLFVLSLSPLFAWLWLSLGKKGIKLATPYKFSLSFFCIGLFFMLLKVSTVVANNGMVNPLWLVLGYFFQVVGELLLSPIGLAIISVLAPKHLVGMMMGLWFLCISLGFFIGEKLSSLAAIPTDLIKPTTIITIYASNFMLFGYIAMGGALLMLMLASWLKKLSAEK